MKRLTVLIVSLVYLPFCWADTQPRLKAVPSIGWSLDRIVDPTSIGTVTGTDVAFSTLVSCGVIKTDASGNFSCGTASGTGTVTSVSQGTNMSFSIDPITSTGTINLAASPSVTNLTASGTVTGLAVAMTGNICSGTDKLTTDSAGNVICATDQTGGGSNHAILSATHTDSVAGAVARGALLYGNTTPAWDKLTVGGSNTVLTANATDVAWSASPTVTNLTATSTVTGLAIDSTGSIKSASLTASQYVKTDANQVLKSQAVPIPVTDGGTGAQTFTTNGVLYGNTGAAVQVTAQGNTNTVLTANAGVPSFATSPTLTDLTATNTVTGLAIESTGSIKSGSLTASAYVKTDTLKVLSSQITPIPVGDGGTGASTLTLNGVVYGNGASAAQITAQGATNSVLTANAGAPSFSASPTVTNISATATVTGAIVDISTADIRFSALSCSALGNGGKLSLDANGAVKCFADVSGSGSGITSISQGTNMSFSVDPIVATGTISLAASPSVTNLTASSTVTGLVVSATGELDVGSDAMTDITGSGLSIVGGALTAEQADLQTFTNTGANTWTMPIGAKLITVLICGGGGSGAGGQGAAAGSLRSGGGGGGGASCARGTFLASDVTPSQTVTIGAGGVSAAGGADGNVGTSSTFGTFLTGYGGGGGGNGTGGGGGGGGGCTTVGASSTTATGGIGGDCFIAGAAVNTSTSDALGAGGGSAGATGSLGGSSIYGGAGGGATSTTGTAVGRKGANSMWSAASGGGGGGVDAVNPGTVRDGGAGGDTGGNVIVASGGGGGGTGGSVCGSGGDGAAGTAATSTDMGKGGAGGGSRNDATGCAGGTGGVGGGGGGGGGGGTSTGGAGGAGGAGKAWVWSIY